MSNPTVMPVPVFSWPDGAGYLLYTYASGTLTPLGTYSDAALTPNQNPVELNGAGWAPIWLAGASYKFILKTPAGATVWSADGISAVPPYNIELDVSGTAGENLVTGDVVYLATGLIGGTVAGRWYKADADAPGSSSQAVGLGIVPAAIAIGATGSIRRAGRATGYAGLSPGTVYFASATAGALTATQPAHARIVGIADSTTSIVLATDQVLPRPSTCQGRLTLETGVPVSVTDQTAKTTVYFTPYHGNQIALYTGSRWIERTFTELSFDLAGQAANTNLDLFLEDVAGATMTLTVVAWSTATARATAIVLQDGVWVQSGFPQRRYLGTVRTTGTIGQCEDSLAKRFVYNAAKSARVRRPLRVLEATDSWTYTTLTWRQANGAAANQLAIVNGLADDSIAVRVLASSNNGGTIARQIGIGVDSTSALTSGCLTPLVTNAEPTAMVAALLTTPAIGFHYFAWLEISVATGTTTWYGDNGDATKYQSGIDADWAA